MQLTLAGRDFYLDGLVLECILSNFTARGLAIISEVSRCLRAPAQLAAHRSLVLLVQQLQSSLLRHCQRGSWIGQLADWEAVAAANVLWLQAEEAHTASVKQGDDDHLVRRVHDLSGRGNWASSQLASRMPVLRPNLLNGHAAFEFEGSSVLKTRPFSKPLQQPITLVIVGRARGDTTMVDSLTPQYAAQCRSSSRRPHPHAPLRPPPIPCSTPPIPVPPRAFACVLHAWGMRVRVRVIKG